MPVSLRVSADVMQRVAQLAMRNDMTAHAFMLEAIREKIDAEEAQSAFRAEAASRLAKMKKTGKGVPAHEVFDYLSSRARKEKAKRPKARKAP